MPRCPHGDGADDHGEFLIQEKNKLETHESTVSDQVEILSGGKILLNFKF